MSQTYCERCGLLCPMRWLHAGGVSLDPIRSINVPIAP